jgi:hypothetical protein
MILYNVTVKIDYESHTRWLEWMEHTHIPQVMQTACFSEYRFCKLLDTDESDGFTYAVQYLAKNMEAIADYQQHFAPALQADYKKNFEGHYVVFRSLLEVIHKG